MQSIVKCSNFHKHSFYVGIWNSNSSVHTCIFIVTGNYTVVLSLPLSLVQLKGKGHCTTCHDGTEWEGGRAETSLYPYTSLAQKGGMWSAPCPDRFIPGRDPLLIVQEVGWASELLWRTRNILPPPGFARSNSRQVTALTVLSQLPLNIVVTYIHSHIA